MPSDGYSSWGEKLAVDMYEDSREINRVGAIESIKADAKLCIQAKKTEMREKESENKRGIYEEISVDDNGKPHIITRNLQITACPRELTNMYFPQLYIVARSSCLSEQIFVLFCQVAEKEEIVYLDPKKVGSGTYILGKFTASGICIFAPMTKAKDYVRQLICLLVKNSTKAVIPEEPGWIETEEGKFSFVTEGRMTWKEIIKQL